MYDSLGEAAAETLTGALYALGAGALSLAGLFLEEMGLQNILAGHHGIGAWEVAFGAVVLYVGVYLLGYGEAWPRIRSAR